MTELDDRPAPGELELVRAFVNTRDVEDGHDELVRPRDLVGWLASHGLSAPSSRASGADLRRAVELREALRALLLANNGGSWPAPAAAVVDAAAARAGLRPELSAVDRTELVASRGGIAAALGAVVATVHGAIWDGSWDRLKACPGRSCQWAFYDYSRNRSSRWCHMELCGNREKSRRFRHRRATAGSSAD